MRLRLRFVSGLFVVLLTGCGSTSSGGTSPTHPGPPASNDAGGRGGTDGGGGGAGGATNADSGAAGTGADAGTACGATVTAAPGLVVTDRGPVQGTQTNGTWAFEGIPYAAPPIGALRWKAPAPHACWSTPLDASNFGAICLQISTTDATQVLGDEDCLTLNVWVPANATPASKLPVLFFIHGGGNVQGSSADKTAGVYIYGGDALAAHDNAIVVTINYRLGAMGWLAHPAFAAENAHQSAGNYGTLDQIAALEWVQSNIAAFGGDPSHVLVFGQSAGAVDVCSLVVSPLAKGLFSAALMESGGCTAIPKLTATAFTGTFATKVGCDAATDVAACLRNVSAHDVTAALPEPASITGAKQGDYQPSVDGWVFPDSPANILKAGTHNHVPLVIGVNSDETAREIPASMTEAEFDASVLTYAGGIQTIADKVTAMYPASDYGNSYTKAFTAVTTDAKFICTARYDARLAAMGQAGTPTYRYFYTHALDNAQAAVKAYGAWHGIELTFVFRRTNIAGYQPSAGELALSDAIDADWLSLAATGNPTATGLTWPDYDASTDPFVQLDDTISTGDGVRTKYCDFWDSLLGR